MKNVLISLLATLPVAADPGIFAKDSQWETVTKGHKFAEGMAFDLLGNLVFTDVPRGKLFRIDQQTGKEILLDSRIANANGIAVGPDHRLYGCGSRQIFAWNMQTWKRTVVATGPHSNDIAIRKDGTIFFTDPQTKSVWRITARERKLEKAADLTWNPNGIAHSPDHGTLFVAEFFSKNVHRFAISEDNALGKDSIAYALRVPPDGKGHLDGMLVLPDSRLIIGTKLGIQIAAPSRPGKPSEPIVIPIPNDLPRCNYVRISPDRKWLYAAHASAILRRELKPAFFREEPPN